MDGELLGLLMIILKFSKKDKEGFKRCFVLGR
jgi:hypothetical protein